jgi:plasmid stabilization system protein ParE
MTPKPFKEAEGYAEDLQIAFDYYKAYNPQSAARFLTAYQMAVMRLMRDPQVCRLRRHGWRQMVIRRYSGFSIFYREFKGYWLLGGVISTLRDPDLIQARLLIREIADELK